VVWKNKNKELLNAVSLETQPMSTHFRFSLVPPGLHMHVASLCKTKTIMVKVARFSLPRHIPNESAPFVHTSHALDPDQDMLTCDARHEHMLG
jgi:hypothetical protein